MSVSQNGWSVYTSHPGGTCQWITGYVRGGDVAVVFDYLGQRFNATVEHIRKDWSWGWNYRPIRGSTVTSNHSSGTAVDFNAPAHPLGKTGTFSAKQRAAINKILSDCGGVIRWGGNYSGRKDEMHFEIVKNAASVKTLADKIRAKKMPGQVAPWKPNPNVKSTLSIIQTQFQIAAGVKKGKIARYNGIGLIQQKIGATVDGYCGPDTVKKWKAYEHGLPASKKSGRETTPDPKSLAAMGLAKNFVGPEAK